MKSFYWFSKETILCNATSSCKEASCIKFYFINKAALWMALLIMLMSFTNITSAPTGYTISGKVTEANGGKPMQNASVHLKGSVFSTLSKVDWAHKMSALAILRTP